MNKVVSTILLDEYDNYTYIDGSLPQRTQWDKALLSAHLNREIVSDNGYNMLPPSLQEKVVKTHGEPYPITVPEIDALTDILIVTRGKSKDMPGKKFRFTNFTKILAEQRIEIWQRK